MKKFLNACVFNVIHAKETIKKALLACVTIQILRALTYTDIYTSIVEGQSWSRNSDIMNQYEKHDCSFENCGKVADMYVIDQDKH